MDFLRPIVKFLEVEVTDSMVSTGLGEVLARVGNAMLDLHMT